MPSEDPNYARKKKVIKSALFKSKMSFMSEMIKRCTLKAFADLQSEGPETTVDIQKFTNTLQATAILSIIVGLEYSYRTLPHVCLKTGKRTEMSLGDYFNQIIEDIMYRIMTNPLIMMNPKKYIDKEYLTVDKRMFENSRILRGFVREIVEERKRRANPDADDLVSLIL